MSGAPPPKLATFLMERLAGCEPVILGDIQEEYCAGRSRWWYWREALSVVAWSLLRAIQRHPVKFVRAIAMLLVANGIAGYAVWVVRFALMEYVMREMPGWVYGRYQLHTLAWISLSFPICAVATWSMARLHPEVRVPATLVVLALAVPNVMGDPELQRLWAHMAELRFLPYLLRHILGITVWLAAIVVGGIIVPVQLRASAGTSR